MGCICLTKYNAKASSKHWEDFDSVETCIDGICQMFERHLKRANSGKQQITYDVQDLFDYIDALPDLSILVQNEKHHVYEPKGKQWIKENLFKQLKEQAGGS